MTTKHSYSRRAALRRIVCISLMLLTGAPVLAQEAIKIGAVLSLTGVGAGLGVPEKHGALLAEKAINQRGGVKGRPIKIIIEDDGSKADIAKSKAESLIYSEKVTAMIGPSLTASTGAVASITNSAPMVQIACTGLGPQIEQSYKKLFHVLPPQVLNAKALLEYATKAAKAKRIGVLHDSGYGNVVMAAMKSVVESYAVEFVATEKFDKFQEPARS